MPERPEDETDPLIEQALRLGELRKQVMDQIDGPMIEGGTENLPMDMQEHFWQYVLAFESAELTTLERRLQEEAGFVAQNLDALEDPRQVHAALWDLLRALASIRVFLNCTDHLDDAELYRLLLEKALPDETTAPPAGFAVNTRIDVVDYGTTENHDGTDTWLRYYADDLTRSEWDGPVPPQEPLPYDRDSKLPLPPEESTEEAW
jgi:hypothetical protein